MFPKATVLIAEDDDLIRNILVEIIKDEGFKVLEAPDGQKALMLMASKPVNIVITDIKMPVMNGFDLLKAVKGGHPEIPVVFITGFNSEFKEKDAFEAGADAYLTKPFKVADVASTLREMHLKIAERALRSTK